MSFSHNPVTTKYLVTKQFYNGFCRIFPKEICEMILDIYFGSIARIKWCNSNIKYRIKYASFNRFGDWLSHFFYIRRSQQQVTTFMNNNKNFIKKQIPIVVNWYYDCKCCQKHQIQKPYFNDKDELCIITKPEAFSMLFHERHHENCYCDCRHKSRFLARTWLKIMNFEKKRNLKRIRDSYLFVKLN